MAESRREKESLHPAHYFVDNREAKCFSITVAALPFPQDVAKTSGVKEPCSISVKLKRFATIIIIIAICSKKRAVCGYSIIVTCVSRSKGPPLLFA